MTSLLPLRLPRARATAFTLTELVIAMGIFIIGGAVALPFLTGDLGLYARNFSINKSNNSLRYSLQSLKQDLDMSIEPPLLITCAVNAAGTATFTPLATAATNGQAILAWVNYGPAYQLNPANFALNGVKGTPITPPSVTINRYVATAANLAADPLAVTAPLPKVGDRILFMSPGPYNTTPGKNSAIMPENVTMAGVQVQKPGRLITAVNPASDPVGGTPAAQFTVTFDTTNPLPTDANGNCVVHDTNTVFFFRESVYAAYTINDAAGKPVERQLLFYPSIANPANPKLLIRDLDPTPQEVDANLGGALIQPFNYYGTGRGALSALSVNLPIRALDYAHAVADRNLGAQTTDTSSTEFNIYLRSSVALHIKGRLVDSSLALIKPN